MSGLADGFGRRIDYVRLSVTDRCDLRCRYCMPEAMRFLPRAEMLSVDELDALAGALVARGVTRIRLTGGEPLVRKGIDEIAERLGRRLGAGLDELTLTTNGTQLASKAAMLAAAGVRRVNVSLDTIDAATYAALARRDALGRVLEGIEAARAAGLSVKINTVALKGLNEEELPALMEWAHARGHAISFIEVMPMGEVDEARFDQFLPLSVLEERLRARFTLSPSTLRTGGPSRYHHVAETGGTVGLISPLTDNFCAGCNRIRITATGQLYPCLGGGQRIDLRTALRSGGPGALDAALDAAMIAKPERHDFAIGPDRTRAVAGRHMSVTGG